MVNEAMDKMKKNKANKGRRRSKTSLSPFLPTRVNEDLDGSYFMGVSDDLDVINLMKQTKEFLVRLDLKETIEDFSSIGLTDPSDYKSCRLAKEKVKNFTLAKTNLEE